MRERTITAAPTPMPAFAPVERPESEESGSLVGCDVDDSVGELEVGFPVAVVGSSVDDVPVDVADEVELLDELVRCGTRVNWFSLLSNRAAICGLDGKTSNRPTPSSQQKARYPSQQYEVSLCVTLEHETRSVPPVCATVLITSG